jgi:hypothetical protein
MSRAAIGVRTHSGWAALVVVAGDARSPRVIDRRRIELVDQEVREAKQPYHAARELPLPEAEKLLSRCTQRTKLLARQALRAVTKNLLEQGHDLVGCGIVLASGRSLPALAATLASHALIHTAEGELFRNAIAHAGQHCGLPVTGVKERDLFARASTQLRIPDGKLRRCLVDMGQSVGPPWSQDQKHAALVGWLALAAVLPKKGRPPA